MNKLSSNYKVISFLTGFFGCWAIQETIGITVRNPLTVVLFVCLYIFSNKVYGYRYSGQSPKGVMAVRVLVPLVAAIVLAWFINPGVAASFTSSAFRLLSLAILFAGYFLLLELAISTVFLLTQKQQFTLREQDEKKIEFKPLDKGSERKIFAAATIVCLLCYLPYFLYEFPGIMTADSLVQYEQILSRIPLSNHHPVIHTLTIKLFYRIGLMFTENPISALAFYTVAQMIFISICNGVAVREIARIEGCINKKHILAAIIFFALVPFNAVFAVTVWKDVPFAGIAVLLCCRLIEMYRKKEEGLKFWDFAAYSILGILFSLYRSNGWIAFLLFTPFFMVTFRKELRKALISTFLCIAVVMTVKIPLFNAMGVQGPDFIESLSLPMQQVARVLAKGGKVDENDLAMIDECMDRTYVRELYVPWYADNIKELVRAGHPEVIEENKKGYLGLWLRVFAGNPIEYIKAFYELEGGYFYPDVPYAVADADGIMDNDLGLYPTPIIGGAFIKVKEILLKLSDFMPIYGWLFSIGFYTWGVVLGLVAVIRQKRMALVHILMLLIVGTLLIAAPVVDFRYAYAMILSMPLWAALSFSESFVKGEKSSDGTTDQGVH